jgi:NADPH-dependent glutamate synthase beta subunit-like oxidoreductase
LKPTDITNPDYFHKVVDCQWACPAHTPVPEYIRLIAHGRYSDAYMINWKSNVFPGILGRTCDRPCEPACRRSRVEDETLVKGKKEPVAICRLKRVAADYKDDAIAERMPRAPARNGKRVACVGGGPASLTVARDLAVLGYEIVIRPGSQARRFHPHADPALPPARVGDRRGGGLHHRHRQHRIPPSEDRFDEEAPR